MGGRRTKQADGILREAEAHREHVGPRDELRIRGGLPDRLPHGRSNFKVQNPGRRRSSREQFEDVSPYPIRVGRGEFRVKMFAASEDEEAQIAQG